MGRVHLNKNRFQLGSAKVELVRSALSTEDREQTTAFTGWLQLKASLVVCDWLS